MNKIIKVVTAAILSADQQVLLVRKKGTDAFMLPGGKIENNENSLQALSRELSEELSADLSSNRFEQLGSFRDIAANETGFDVEAIVFITNFDGEVDPKAEIEELRWYDPELSDNIKLAPLLQNQVLPALQNYLNHSGVVQ
ncbi:MAG: NUDIX domain-containing protein [Devosiaceae bacterium]|nr:NUDIX domain-containing protein [Devosiaceae bacterium]